jgi:hypothetical protein
MPPDCDRHKKIGKDRLIENRSKFVRAQTIRLENECKVVQRALWRADGLALDWALNREKGIYREFWPVEDCDRSKFAKEVAKRCRSLGGGRKVLSTKTKPDAVEVTWSAASQEDGPAVPSPVAKDATSVRNVIKLMVTLDSLVVDFTRAKNPTKESSRKNEIMSKVAG